MKVFKRLQKKIEQLIEENRKLKQILDRSQLPAHGKKKQMSERKQQRLFFIFYFCVVISMLLISCQ